MRESKSWFRTLLQVLDPVGIVGLAFRVIVAIFIVFVVLPAAVSGYLPELRKVSLTADQRAVAVPIAAALLTATIGAGLAFCWTWVLKRRDENREMRAATRLIDCELAQAAALLDPLKGGRGKRAWDRADLLRTPQPRMDELEIVERAGGLEAWQALRQRQLITATAWEDHKLVLARHMKYHEWDRVRSAYAAIQNVQENGVEPDMTLFLIDGVRASMLRRIDRARGVCERFIGDNPDDKYALIDMALDEAAATADGGPHTVGLSELVVELRCAVDWRGFSARDAESLAGYLLLRSAGAVTHLSPDEYEAREAEVRNFGFVLDLSQEPSDETRTSG